jgi:hypothetical protein
MTPDPPSPHLTPENHTTLLDEAAGRSKRQVEEMLARRFPKPDVASVVRRLPEPRPTQMNPAGSFPAATTESPCAVPVVLPPASVAAAPVPSTPAPRGSVGPLSATRYEIRFTASDVTRAKLDRARDLLRHAVPGGDLAEVFDRALTLLVADLERKKCAANDRTSRPRPVVPHSRHVPAAVRGAVWARDGGRCAFVAPAGRRCDATSLLEFHHVEPYGAGGEPTIANIQIRCAAHNRYEAKVYYDAIRKDRAVYEDGLGPDLVHVRQRIGTSTGSPPAAIGRSPLQEKTFGPG